MVEGPSGVQLLPACPGRYEMANLGAAERARLREAITEIAPLFDVVVIDTGAGIGSNAVDFVTITDEIVLVTTPDMLHVGILPHHAAWRGFFRSLRLVVVDELHAYRGIFGSHVAQVLRRALRVAAFHGAAPRIVAASATIANPGELAQALSGRPFEVVRENGAPLPRRHVLLLRPEASPYTLAARLFRLAVGMGLRTIAFTKARRTTEPIERLRGEVPRLIGSPS